MKRLQAVCRRHQTKLWMLTGIVVGLLVLNVAAQRDTTMPTQWEYKTVGFRMTLGDDMATLQAAFAGILNREAAGGWEFAGRCLHVDAEEYWVDYVVFRRPRR